MRSFLVRFLLFAGSLSSLPADVREELQNRQHSVSLGIILAVTIKVLSCGCNDVKPDKRIDVSEDAAASTTRLQSNR